MVGWMDGWVVLGVVGDAEVVELRNLLELGAVGFVCVYVCMGCMWGVSKRKGRSWNGRPPCPSRKNRPRAHQHGQQHPKPRPAAADTHRPPPPPPPPTRTPGKLPGELLLDGVEQAAALRLRGLVDPLAEERGAGQQLLLRVARVGDHGGRLWVGVGGVCVWGGVVRFDCGGCINAAETWVGLGILPATGGRT